MSVKGVPGGSVVENPPASAGGRRHRFCPWVGKLPCRRKWQPAPVFLPGKSRGPGSLAGSGRWGRLESDRTERLSNSHTP